MANGIQDLLKGKGDEYNVYLVIRMCLLLYITKYQSLPQLLEGSIKIKDNRSFLSTCGKSWDHGI